MRIEIGIIGTLMLLSGMPAQAQILKCIGKDGKIEFATSCPAGTKQQDTGVSNKPVAAPPAKGKGESAGKEGAKGAAPTLADRDADYRKRQAEQKEAATKSEEKSAETADRQRACESARSNLQSLKDRQRMYRADPNTGERITFDEADYVREIPITERQIAQNCKA